MDAVGPAFEESPWIARAAYALRPFADVAALHGAMVALVHESPRDRQIALITAHPDLAGRLARARRLTPASHEEQRAAGLDCLSPQESTQLEQLNETYRTRFGFPFVICAREQTPGSIVAQLESRLQNDRESEIDTALAEIAKIARLRLNDAVRQ